MGIRLSKQTHEHLAGKFIRLSTPCPIHVESCAFLVHTCTSIYKCVENLDVLFHGFATCKCVVFLQGEFPDKDTQEDGYAGVAPVDAFPAQNKFGKICLINYQD